MAESGTSSSETTPRSSFLFGVGMACTTMVLWAAQPVLMKVALGGFPPASITFLRLSFATLGFFAFLHYRSVRPWRYYASAPSLALLTGIALGLYNYSFVKGIELTGPVNIQVLSQLGPLLLPLVGIMIFRERLSTKQVFGFVAAILGLGLFCADHLLAGSDVHRYHLAGVQVLVAAVSFVVFSASQRLLSNRCNVDQVNLIAFTVAAVFTGVTTDWWQWNNPSIAEVSAVAALGVTTLISYNALSAAIRTIPLSLVGIIVSVSPLVTLVIVSTLQALTIASLEPKTGGTPSLLGALVTVLGVMLVISRGSSRGRANASIRHQTAL
jgi:drug/metabolite transporter (DMT)-like permease